MLVPDRHHHPTAAGEVAGGDRIVDGDRVCLDGCIAHGRTGDGAELRIITAVILGGASLSGGRGTVWGTLAGVLFISLINNVMIFARLSPEWQSIIIGCVLVIAVAMDRFLGARR